MTHQQRRCTAELLECEGDECGVGLVKGPKFSGEIGDIFLKGEKERAIFFTLLKCVFWRGVGESICRVIIG